MNELSRKVIGAAFEVSNVLGVGFLEKVYENALLHELHERGLHAVGQRRLQVRYKDAVVGDYIADIVVERQLIVEVKCCSNFADEHTAQALNYLRATGYSLALLMNFHKPKVEIKRIAL
ncbi:MAG: GxxExxY protein [Phycisphaeraceae bacterium]